MYFRLAPYNDGSGDDVIFVDDDLADAAIFSTITGALTSNSNGDVETAKVDGAAPLPSPLRFDRQVDLTNRERSEEQTTGQDSTALIDCTTTGGTLSCTAQGDPSILAFYLCPQQGDTVQVGPSTPDGCTSLGLNVVAPDGTPASTTGDCVAVTATYASVTSAIEASKTSDLAQVTSACVPSPLATFILQASDSGTNQDGQYVSLQYSGDTEFDDILAFTATDPSNAVDFSLDPSSSALISTQGRYSSATETGNIHPGDSLFRFDTITQMQGNSPEHVNCDISFGTLSCRLSEENQDHFFSFCDAGPGVHANTDSTPGPGCYPVTLNVQAPDGTPAAAAAAAQYAGVATSTPPSTTAAPVVTPAAPIPAPTTFKLSARSATTFPDPAYIVLGDVDADNTDDFNFAGGRGTVFYLDSTARLSSTQGTVSTGVEQAYINEEAGGSTPVLKMHEDLGQTYGRNEVDIYSTCSIQDGGVLKCTTFNYDTFQLCRSMDTNSLKLRVGAGVGDGCEEITLTIFDVQY